MVKSESSNEGWVTQWSFKQYLKSIRRASQGFSFVRKVGGEGASESQIALMFL